MPMFTKQRDAFTRSGQPSNTQDTLTIGVVVDTNDPQQMGRVRVICPQWGDSYRTPVEDLPWASYVSPFGGQVSVGARGPGDDASEGGISYGMWAIPKVAAQVIVMCVDGDPRLRVYMGCIFTQLTPHTLPHGRWMSDDHPGLETNGGGQHPQGPYTSQEKAIKPLTSNLQEAFGQKGDPNYEWRSRAADYSVAGIDVSQIGGTHSGVQDDKNAMLDGWSSTQGYAHSRIDPDSESSYTDKNYDSTVYSITTPGFHAISMDDRQENCRMRFRTASGHQILMDDTNERIYIATAKGNNWIEMDQDGNIDIFTEHNVSVRAKEDINFTANGSIRMYADKGIHMVSKGDDGIRLQADKDIHVTTAQNVKVLATQDIHVKATGNINVEGSNLKLTGTTNVDVHATNLALTGTTKVDVHATNLALTGSDNVNVYGATALNMSSDTDVGIKGSNVNINGTSAVSVGPTQVNIGGSVSLGNPGSSASAVDSLPAGLAGLAAPAAPAPAFFTSRTPAHEPWARTMTKKTNDTLAPEFDYTSSDVNRSVRGRTIPRGKFWRR